MKSGRPYAAALLAAAAFAVGAWLAFQGTSTGQKLPDAGYTRLDGTHGATGAMRGRVTLISFRATECPTWAHQMSHLAATGERFKVRGDEA